jgi:hypothetical protein
VAETKNVRFPEWISAADAVQAIAKHLGCDLNSSADILLAYSKGRSARVRYSIYTIDLHDEVNKPQPEVTEPLVMEPEDWLTLVDDLKSRGAFNWVKNQVELIESTTSDSDGRVSERMHSTTIFGSLEFASADLKPIIEPVRAGNGGPKFGAFWPTLAVEFAAEIHIHGVPKEEGTSQEEAIKRILGRVAAIEVKGPERSAVFPLFGKLWNSIHDRPS